MRAGLISIFENDVFLRRLRGLRAFFTNRPIAVGDHLGKLRGENRCRRSAGAGSSDLGHLHPAFKALGTLASKNVARGFLKQEFAAGPVGQPSWENRTCAGTTVATRSVTTEFADPGNGETPRGAGFFLGELFLWLFPAKQLGI